MKKNFIIITIKNFKKSPNYYHYWYYYFVRKTHIINGLTAFCRKDGPLGGDLKPLNWFDCLYCALCVSVSFFFKGKTATCTRIYPQQRPIIVLQSEPHITNLIGKTIDLSTQSWAPFPCGFNSHAKNHSLIEGPTIERISLPVVGSPNHAHITSRRVLTKEKQNKRWASGGTHQMEIVVSRTRVQWCLAVGSSLIDATKSLNPTPLPSPAPPPPPPPKVSRSCHFGATWGCLSGSTYVLPKYYYFYFYFYF